MTPAQLIKQLERQHPAPVYLFLGPETWRRGACRDAIVAKVLDEDQRDEGITRHDLDEMSLTEVLDDARSMSLFATNRVIFVSGAESALPRGRAAAASGDEDGDGKKPDAASAQALEDYCKDPTPGTVLVFDARKYDFDGEDKAKLERVRKFYAAVKDVVEFARMSADEARDLVRQQAAASGVQLSPQDAGMLVEITSADPARIVNEIEKLALYAKLNGGKVTSADILALVPDSGETTIFKLVDALARRNRAQAMETLDLLVREGEYLPLALTFLGGIFRLALASREQNLRSSNEVQSYFQRQGVPMWRARAEQIYTASAKFSREKLEEAIELVFRADRDLKSSRPDDRLVMEDFLFRLTA